MSTIAIERPRTQIKWMPLVGARNRRGQMNLLMLLADVSGFAAAAGLVLVLNLLLKLFVLDTEDLKYLIIPAFCMVLFIHSKLYPGVGVNPAEEIKLVSEYVTAGFVGGWIVLLSIGAGWTRNHFAIRILWGLSIVCILLARWSVRIEAVNLGLFPCVNRDSAGYRNYNAADRERLGFVTGARQLGISFADIREILAVHDAKETLPPRILELLGEKEIEAEKRIDRLKSIKLELRDMHDAALTLHPARSLQERPLFSLR